MNAQTGFLDETVGVRSSMRLMCFVSLLAAVAFGALTLLNEAATDGEMITLMFLTGAFAPKAVQKFAEKQQGAAPSGGG